MAKNKKTKIIAVVLVALLLATITFIHRSNLDGLSGIVWSSFFSEDTLYAEGYTESKYKAILIGMGKREVRAILGKPLVEWDYSNNEGQTVKVDSYSKSPSDTHYRIRQIRYKENIVTDKSAYFYVD